MRHLGLACLLLAVGCVGEQGPTGPMGEMGEMGDMGEGVFNSAVAISNSLELQAGNFNITGVGMIGNSARIGAAGPTAMPQLTLEVNSTTDAQVSVSTANDLANHFSQMMFDRARGTLATRADVAAGDDIFRIYARAYKGGMLRDAATIGAVVDGAPTASHVPGALTFATNSGAGLAERMRVTAAGRVGIGTTAPAAQLDVLGGIRTQWSGSSVVTLAASNVITHNFNIPGPNIVLVTNGDPPANGAIVIGAIGGANAFTVYSSGGSPGNGVRFNWVILAL